MHKILIYLHIIHLLKSSTCFEHYPAQLQEVYFVSVIIIAITKLAKTGHGPHSSTLVVICVARLLFVLFYVLFVCKCVLPPGDNPIAVNKYIIYIIKLIFKELGRGSMDWIDLAYDGDKWQAVVKTAVNLWVQ